VFAPAVTLIIHSTTGIYRLKFYTLVRKYGFIWGQATKDSSERPHLPISLFKVHREYLCERPVHIPHKIACVVAELRLIPCLQAPLTLIQLILTFRTLKSSF